MLVTKSQVKYIQSLGHKKFRDQEGVFVVEGPKIVEELLVASNMLPRQIYATKDWTGLPGVKGPARLSTGAVPVPSQPKLIDPNGATKVPFCRIVEA